MTVFVQHEKLEPDQQHWPSLVEIKAALPEYVFKPILTTSLYYVAKDVIIVFCLFLFAHNFCHRAPLLLWPLYIFFQGTMFWSIFVLGHDCGHGSFSSFPIINDIVGTILHTSILVPYYSWKLSHRHHHKNTGNIDRDEIFYPIKRDEHVFNPNEFIYRMYFGLGLGWMGYLVSGYSPRVCNHFDPFETIFANHALGVMTSLASFGGFVLFLTVLTLEYGMQQMFLYYFAPIAVFATWLVVTTFLHHNGTNVDWYSDDQWTYVKGNVSSIDRNYGIFHTLVHNIGTHQVHHLFPAIPHYYLEYATVAFRKHFPHLVRKSDEPVILGFLKQARIYGQQHIIPSSTKVFRYRDPAARADKAHRKE